MGVGRWNEHVFLGLGVGDRRPRVTRRSFVALGALALGGVAAAQDANYPVKGRTMTVLIPFAPGGPSDVSARILTSFLEKELGVNFQIVPKPGAGTQIASTELLRAKPDGYTILMAPPLSMSLSYLDPDRQAPYSRADFQPIAHFSSESNLLIVPGDSPYKSVGALVAAAKERPRRIKVGTVGLMGNTHLAGIALEEASGARFAFVHFNGAAPLATAMLGGNLDAAVTGILSTLPHERAGTMRVLATLGETGTRFFPGVKSLRELGYDVYSPSPFGFFGRADLPKPIVDRLAGAIKAVMESDAFKARFQELTMDAAYLGPSEFAAAWDRIDVDMRRLLAKAKQRQE